MTFALALGCGLLLAALSFAVLARRSRLSKAAASARSETRKAKCVSPISRAGQSAPPRPAGLRDIEARVEASLAVLDEMIVEADREIERLEALLDATHPGVSHTAVGRQPDGIVSLPWTGGRRPLSAEQREMIRILARTGYTAAEVARMLGYPLDLVNAVLRDADEDCPTAEAA